MPSPLMSCWPRYAVLLVAALITLCADISTAHAQSASCSRLQASLDQFTQNPDFRNFQINSQNAQDLARQVQNAESAYVRTGCNDAARAGQVLTPQCQGIAREVLSLRDQYANVATAVETGNAMAQQREAILQELARFGCGTGGGGSNAVFSQERQGLFDRIFGNGSSTPDFQDGQWIDNSGYWGYGGYNTVRTVCVRLSDGYFWPISYATLPEYAMNDASQCQQMCPNTPVELYMYDNPGQEPEQMRNLYGEPYSSLPNAFRYREEFDSESQCREPTVSGKITVASGESGDSRAMVEYGGVQFPLPMPDPRRQTPVAVAALDNSAYVDVPLPRPRPAGPGEAPAPQEVEDEEDEDMRLVQFGERVVRIVGPETPYARPVAAGS